MRIMPIAKNQTVLVLNDAEILFSYETPVAAFFFDERKTIRTSEKFSRTTSKHINQWARIANCASCREVNQDYLNALVGDVRRPL